MEALTVAAAGAAVTKVIDLIRNIIGRSWPEEEQQKKEKEKKWKWVWNLLALGVGVVVAFLFDVKPVELPGLAVGEVGIKVATGLAIGGISSGWHEFFDFLSGAAKRAHGATVPSTAAAAGASGPVPPATAG
jgi:hypothetical protein